MGPLHPVVIGQTFPREGLPCGSCPWRIHSARSAPFACLRADKRPHGAVLPGVALPREHHRLVCPSGYRRTRWVLYTRFSPPGPQGAGRQVESVPVPLGIRGTPTRLLQLVCVHRGRPPARLGLPHRGAPSDFYSPDRQGPGRATLPGINPGGAYGRLLGAWSGSPSLFGKEFPPCAVLPVTTPPRSGDCYIRHPQIQGAVHLFALKWTTPRWESALFTARPKGPHTEILKRMEKVPAALAKGVFSPNLHPDPYIAPVPHRQGDTIVANGGALLAGRLGPGGTAPAHSAEVPALVRKTPLHSCTRMRVHSRVLSPMSATFAAVRLLTECAPLGRLHSV